MSGPAGAGDRSENVAPFGSDDWAGEKACHRTMCRRLGIDG